ncbi:hypothetical protein BpHYR1_022955 [Brachionus plicatilis]|uniref:Uncharacterized protein n=1 Tax=Brachionus plicatilis TaxID=10195 RepID=A0A3M7PV75_BRAPC|nr:hypothetical protein BpHYR1_022955 [Brachionus plicatilis]
MFSKTFQLIKQAFPPQSVESENFSAKKSVIYCSEHQGNKLNYNEKVNKVQRALYSLRGIGCRAYGLNPIKKSKLFSIISRTTIPTINVRRILSLTILGEQE